MRWRARFVAWLAVILAVLIQGAFITRLNIPIAITPVVVVVAAMRMTRTEAAFLGFFAGLLLDLAPPATGLLGAQALVLCLVAYFAAAKQSLVPRVWWVRAILIGAIATFATSVIVSIQVLAGEKLNVGIHLISAAGWQFVLGTALAIPLWALSVSTMGPAPRRRMGVAP